MGDSSVIEAVGSAGRALDDMGHYDLGGKDTDRRSRRLLWQAWI